MTVKEIRKELKKIYNDLEHLERRFKETASFDVSEDKVNNNFEHFLKILNKEGLINEK